MCRVVVFFAYLRCQFCFHLWGFHPRDLVAQVDCVCRLYLHSPPVSITPLICILGSEEEKTVFIITRQQQEKQSKGEMESHQNNLMEKYSLRWSWSSQTLIPRDKSNLFHAGVKLQQSLVRWMKWKWFLRACVCVISACNFTPSPPFTLLQSEKSPL